MNILILGAGQVGSTTAKQLAKEEDNEITIVDINPDKLSKLSNTTDLRVVEGNASYPNILKAAGADTADMLVALTSSDEVNMIACQIGLLNILIIRICFQRLKSQWSIILSQKS